ncbi:glycine rich domain-containing protein [Clostridioides difficile]|nr:glycine rich domain-containing protein [Clostridioides difficile]
MATVYEFNYTGKGQIVTLPPGKYKLECWGAGGSYSSGVPSDCISRGGYASGELVLKKSTILYVYVGQGGKSAFDSSSYESFNGGGKGTYAYGGGSTDIRLSGYTTTQWDAPWSLVSRLIVAGGGGGIVQGFQSSDGTRKGDAHGGGLIGENGRGSTNYSYVPGGTQIQCGIDFSYSSSPTANDGFGRSSSSSNDVGGGSGWYGGAGAPRGSYNSLKCNGSGGSGYVLTKDSYKPVGLKYGSSLPKSEYYMTNPILVTGGNTTSNDGYAKITLLQALPLLTVSSYNSTQAIFKADHTDPALLTKIEVFLDDILKETITTDLTLEKTINYTLEDNALHTLKIVVTDSANATAEKVISISKNIMPLGDDASIRDIVSKMSEIKEGLVNGKTSIIDVLGLKNIDSSLNNTLVELAEKIKLSFDSGDVSLQDLTNKLTQANNTISQLNSKYKYASGTTEALRGTKGIVNRYGVSGTYGYGEFSTWIKVTGLNFVPNIFISFREFNTESYHYVNIVISFVDVFNSDFAITALLGFRRTSGETSYKAALCDIVEVNSRDVYVNSSGVNLPECLLSDYTTRNWYAIKFK